MLKLDQVLHQNVPTPTKVQEIVEVNTLLVLVCSTVLPSEDGNECLQTTWRGCLWMWTRDRWLSLEGQRGTSTQSRLVLFGGSPTEGKRLHVAHQPTSDGDNDFVGLDVGEAGPEVQEFEVSL